MLLFTGNSNKPLAKKVADCLAINLGNASVDAFSDGEINVKIHQNVRGEEVFLLQSLSSPVNDSIMELVIMADAFRRASANKVVAVLPYFGYARQDRRIRSERVPISAKVVADMISNAGFSRVLTIDLHSEQAQGFFNIPVDNIYSTSILIHEIEKKNYPDLMITSPDIGGIPRARTIAKFLSVNLSIIDKRRPKANVSEIVNIIGEVRNKTCLLIDDIIDTAGTLAAAAKALRKNGAKKVIAYATHAVLSGKAIENIENSDLDEVVVTDTIVLPDLAKKSKKIRKISIATFLSECMRRINNRESISALYQN